MNSQKAVLMTGAQKDESKDESKDEYLGDIFSDECVLLEELDTDSFLTTSTSANEDLWDVLEISNDDWLDAQSGGYCMF